MTLLRQLLLSVTVAIVVILIGALVFSINGARDYLNAQLQAQSDNAATSLALTMSQSADPDRAEQELLIMALFDSGQFRAIELRDPDNALLVGRRATETSDAATPDWFDRLLPLQTPRASRPVSSGWSQVGTLTVVADDSDARLSLWITSSRIFGWVVLAGVLWLIFVAVVLRWLRRAVHAEIKRQVDSIAAGKEPEPAYVSPQVVDFMPEGKVLVQAREQVRASREESTATIESLTLELNTDPISGVPNRRYFMNELRRALFVSEQDGKAKQPESGYVLLCRQRDLGLMAQALPRDEVDAWLRGVGSRLEQACEAFFDTRLQLARLNGSDFVILMADVPTSRAMEIAETLRRAVLDSRIMLGSGKHCRWALAMTDYLQGDELAGVMTRLDTALMAAESAGGDDIELLLRSQQDAAAQQVVGEAAWRDLISRALEDDAISLVTELANYGRGQPKRDRYEATLTLHDGSKSMSGYLFMPAAVRLGMSAQLDERAVQLAMIWLQGLDDELVLRISAASIVVPHFIDNMTALLSDAKGLDRLIIELDAFAIASHPAESVELLYALDALGVRVGLRGITRQIDVIAQLEGMPVHYLRLGGGFINQLDSSQGAAALLRAVVHTATALKIQVLADDASGPAAIMMLDDQGVRRRQAPGS